MREEGGRVPEVERDRVTATGDGEGGGQWHRDPHIGEYDLRRLSTSQRTCSRYQRRESTSSSSEKTVAPPSRNPNGLGFDCTGERKSFKARFLGVR